MTPDSLPGRLTSAVAATSICVLAASACDDPHEKTPGQRSEVVQTFNFKSSGPFYIDPVGRTLVLQDVERNINRSITVLIREGDDDYKVISRLPHRLKFESVEACDAPVSKFYLQEVTPSSPLEATFRAGDKVLKIDPATSAICRSGFSACEIMMLGQRPVYYTFVVKREILCAPGGEVARVKAAISLSRFGYPAR